MYYIVFKVSQLEVFRGTKDDIFDVINDKSVLLYLSSQKNMVLQSLYILTTSNFAYKRAYTSSPFIQCTFFTIEGKQMDGKNITCFFTILFSILSISKRKGRQMIFTQGIDHQRYTKSHGRIRVFLAYKQLFSFQAQYERCDIKIKHSFQKASWKITETLTILDTIWTSKSQYQSSLFSQFSIMMITQQQSFLNETTTI